MKQELIDKLVKEGFKVKHSIDAVGVEIWTVKEEEKVLFTNSIEEEFKEGGKCWYFLKDHDNKLWPKYPVVCSVFDRSINCKGDNYASEIYLTEETAYRKSVEYAFGQGEELLGKNTSLFGCDYSPIKCPIWDWDNYHYKLAPKPEHKPYTMEDDLTHLKGKWVTSKEGKAEMMITYLDQSVLNDLFSNWLIDGEVVGKRVD